MPESENDEKTAKETSAEVRRIWNANAEYWDLRMGEGNSFHLELLLPVLERLLDLHSGDRVLDVACGNGQLSRWMAQRGAEVTAIDASEKMIEIARSKSRDVQDKIRYLAADVSDKEAVKQIGEGEFDTIVCNMAIMDMSELGPMVGLVKKFLKKDGNFVFSVTHPCFNRGDMRRVAGESEESGEIVETAGIEIRRYLTPVTVKGISMLGQPEPQLYFERPLRLLLGAFLMSGLVLDAFEEPSFGHNASGEGEKWYSWRNLPEIPPVLIVRFRNSSPS